MLDPRSLSQTNSNTQTQPLIVIAGPCVVESYQCLKDVASVMVPLCKSLGLPYIFKSSYRKANRTSYTSFEGIGDEHALALLAEIRAEFDVPILTDIHSAVEAERAACYADVLQIPAFLCRQTDILRAAASTGKVVNIKKGQFLAPEDIPKAIEKISSPNNPVPVWITERGTSFGYHDLVVDMRSLVYLGTHLQGKRGKEAKVFFDATHSVQQPSIGDVSGGQRSYILPLARAAVAVGIDGVFFETHPKPSEARSDAATQISLHEVEILLRQVHAISALVQTFDNCAEKIPKDIDISDTLT